MPRIVPVIDLKSGSVVRAVAGDRDRYTPIRSRIASDARPATIAEGLVKVFGFDEIYVADLDAIAGSEPDWNAYDAISQSGMRVTLDAGVNSVEKIEQLVRWNDSSQSLERLVVASESLRNLDGLPELLTACGSVTPVFSIDLRGGQWLGQGTELSEKSPLQVIESAARAGCQKFIVLDLAAVGTERGPVTLDLCRAIRLHYPEIELYSGGGARDLQDLKQFAAAGCDGVLVASALHTGTLTADDVKELAEMSRFH